MKTWMFRSLFAVALVAAAGLTLLPSVEVEASGALMTCEYIGGGGYICGASPTGTGFSYAWSRSGFVSLNAGPPSLAVRMASCFGGGSGGTVFVTVTHPDGSQSSASEWLECSGSGF
ncbi:MAG: hypothetical protein MI919_01385 [Holophagales bacterium]|nr:hypothetical protein [Holophagales bacterium]